MGEVSETMTKKKKKGRPSLLDLQKRSLKKEQQQNHHNNHRQNNPNSTNSHSKNTNVATHDDDDDERKEKKHKLLVGLNSHLHNPTLFPNSQPFNSDPKRRKIDPLHNHQTVRFAIPLTHYYSLSVPLIRFVGSSCQNADFLYLFYNLLGIRA